MFGYYREFKLEMVINLGIAKEKIVRMLGYLIVRLVLGLVKKVRFMFILLYIYFFKDRNV